jgi:hypothetical protein
MLCPRLISWLMLGSVISAGAKAQGEDSGGGNTGQQAAQNGGLHARTGGRNPGTGGSVGSGPVGPQSRFGAQGRGSLISRRPMSAPSGGTGAFQGGGSGTIGTGATPEMERAAFDSFRQRTIGLALSEYTPEEYRKRVGEWDQLVRESDGSLRVKSLMGYTSTAMSGPASAIPGGYPMLATWPFGADGLDRLFIRRAVERGATTVNDLVFSYEYRWYRNGWDDGLMSEGDPSCFDPDEGVEGFLAEPASFEAMYGGLDPATQTLMAARTAMTPGESALTRADFAFTSDKPEEAAALYREHIAAAPEDLGARVRLAIVMLESGDVEEATTQIHEAYQTDPSLADVSLRVIVGGWSAPRLRALVTKAVAHANRTGEAEAWMTVAILMEAEGRPALAAKMLERANGAGLDAVLSSRLAAMIGRERP